MNKALLIFAALCLVASAFATAIPLRAAVGDNPGVERWNSDQYGITLTYPSDWTLDVRPETYGVPCVLEAPPSNPDPGQKDPFGAFLMPVFIGEGYFDDIGALEKTWENQFTETWDSNERVSRIETQTGQGYPAVDVRYAVNDEEGLRINWLIRLVLTPANHKAWVIGYCARNEFEHFLGDAQSILDNLELVD